MSSFSHYNPKRIDLSESRAKSKILKIIWIGANKDKNLEEKMFSSKLAMSQCDCFDCVFIGGRNPPSHYILIIFPNEESGAT